MGSMRFAEQIAPMAQAHLPESVQVETYPAFPESVIWQHYDAAGGRGASGQIRLSRILPWGKSLDNRTNPTEGDVAMLIEAIVHDIRADSRDPRYTTEAIARAQSAWHDVKHLEEGSGT